MTEQTERKHPPKIREIEEGDLDRIWEIGDKVEAFRVSDLSHFWPKDTLEKQIRDKENYLMLLAEVGDELAGFVLCEYTPLTTTGVMHDIFVIDKFRRQGIGVALAKEAVSQLKAKGATYIYALAAPDNQASKNLLKSLGFSEGYDFTWMELR